MDLDYWEKVKKIQTPPNSSINYWQSVIAFLIVAILLGSLPCVTKQVVFYLTPPVQLSMRYMIALLFFIPSIIQIIVDLRWLPVSKNPIIPDITTNSSNLSNLLKISSPSRTIYNGKLLRDGLILGLLTFGIHISLSFGVQTISANRASFLFGLCVIFVALLDLLLSIIYGQRQPCA